MVKRRFELVGGSSRKFWEVSVDGPTVTVTFGRIGSNGQSRSRKSRTGAAAKASADKQVAEKIKKGYVPAAVSKRTVKRAVSKAAKPRRSAVAKSRFQQIVSEYGSPFIAVAVEDAASWDGDWQKWKNVEHWRSEYGGVIVQRRGKVKSFVLDADLYTAWVPASSGGVFVRGGIHFVSRKQAENIAAAIPPKTWKRLRSTLDLPSGALVVFDAGVAGTADLKRLRQDSAGGIIAVVLGAGSYVLSVADAGAYELVRLTAT